MSPTILRGVVPGEVCEQIVLAARSCGVDRSRIHETGDLYRDTELRWLERRPEHDWLFEKATGWAATMNKAYGFDLDEIEQPLQFCAYGPDHHFDWHMDIGPGDMARRKLSLTLQLSTPSAYDGGGLEFSGIGELSMSRIQGTVIAFPSFLQHRVTPITRGLRESLVMWWRGPAFR